MSAIEALRKRRLEQAEIASKAAEKQAFSDVFFCLGEPLVNCSRVDEFQGNNREKFASDLMKFGSFCRERGLADRTEFLSPKTDIEQFVCDLLKASIAGKGEEVAAMIRIAGEEFDNDDVLQICRLLSAIPHRIWCAQPLTRQSTLKDIQTYFVLHEKYGSSRMTVDGYWYWNRANTEEAIAWRKIHESIGLSIPTDKLWSRLTKLAKKKGISEVQFWAMNPDEFVAVLIPTDLTQDPADLNSNTKCGPTSRGVFEYNGKRAESIQKAPWRLIEFMFSKQSCDAEEAYRYAIDDSQKSSSEAAIKAMLYKANLALEEVRYPRLLSKLRDERVIAWS